MSRILTALAALLLTLTLVYETQQRPRNYGKLKVCPPGQSCGTYAVESELIDGKAYYVLKYYPEADERAGVDEAGSPPRGAPGSLTDSKPPKGEVKPFEPTYIIGGPTAHCPEGQLPDHSGNCRDVEF